VLRWRAVRVGFVTPLLWSRFGPAWSRVIADLGGEVVVPSPDDIAAALGDRRCELAPTLSARLAVAAAIVCRDCDLVVAPSLLAGERDGPGSAQDPWVAALPDMLAHAVPGLPTILAVPLEVGPGVASVVMPILTRVTRDVGLVRRAWDRHRRALEAPAPAPVAGSDLPAGEGPHLAVVGAPWWFTAASVALLAGAAGRVSGQHLLVPSDAREEGRRVRADLCDVDAEVIGAARRFARRSEVDSLTLVIDDDALGDAWLTRRVRQLAPGARVRSVYDVADAATWARVLAPRPGA
jgi:hypothetical protein